MKAKASKAKKKDKEEVEFLNQQIATALCAMAEIYLTDACFEENAESECQRLLNESLQFDNSNPETFQTLASLRLSQENQEEAIKFLHQGYNLWKDAVFEERPSYEFRHNAAKTFYEVAEYQTAINIWEGLLDEDDNIAEVHYHLALAYGKVDKDIALECVAKAKELLGKTGCLDAELLKQVEEAEADIQKFGTVAPPEDNEMKREESDQDSDKEEMEI